jgi:Flp pilus assembly protein TadD
VRAHLPRRHCQTNLNRPAKGTLTLLDEFDEALALADEILEIEPANIQAWLNRAYIYEQLDRETDACNAIAEIRRLAPNLRVSHMPGNLVINDAAILNRFADSVRKAGLPE